MRFAGICTIAKRREKRATNEKNSLERRTRVGEDGDDTITYRGLGKRSE